MQKQRIEIVRADDDAFDWSVLIWAGCRDLWDQQPILQNFNVIHDVLDHCASAAVEAEEYDLGAPGRSGTYYTLTTNDSDSLREEVRARVLQMLTAASSPTIDAKPSFKSEIVELLQVLEAAAASVGSIHAGAYTGLAAREAAKIRKVSEAIAMCSTERSAAETLARMAPHISVTSFKGLARDWCIRLNNAQDRKLDQ